MRNLTPRQQAWFASVQASLERDTGRSLDQWVAIVRAGCPDGAPSTQRAWLKQVHGLSIVRTAQIVDAMSASSDPWDDAEGLRSALWKNAASNAILVAFEAAIADIPELIPTQRKGYSAWSRKVQFAALKPLRNGQALLGLALPFESDSRLRASKRESWSERLKSAMLIASPADINDSLVTLVRKAWELS